MRTYEAMFLFDAAAVSDYQQAKAEIDRIMERAGARVILCGKWDERRLAYEIRGRKRGLYVLVYFEAEPAAVPGIDRDVRISDVLLRCLVLRADHMTPERMQQAMHSANAPAPAEGGGGPSRRSRAPASPAPVEEEVGVVAEDRDVETRADE